MVVDGDGKVVVDVADIGGPSTQNAAKVTTAEASNRFKAQNAKLKAQNGKFKAKFAELSCSKEGAFFNKIDELQAQKGYFEMKLRKFEKDNDVLQVQKAYLAKDNDELQAQKGYFEMKLCKFKEDNGKLKAQIDELKEERDRCRSESAAAFNLFVEFL